MSHRGVKQRDLRTRLGASLVHDGWPRPGRGSQARVGTSGLDETRDRLRANGPRNARVHAMPGARVHEMVAEWPEELAYGAEQNANQAFGAWLLGHTVILLCLLSWRQAAVAGQGCIRPTPSPPSIGPSQGRSRASCRPVRNGTFDPTQRGTRICDCWAPL